MTSPALCLFSGSLPTFSDPASSSLHFRSSEHVTFNGPPLLSWRATGKGRGQRHRFEKSMTGYLMSLNGGPISWWKSSRQVGASLSSSEAEFVAASQAGQEVAYLRALLKGFVYTQMDPTEIWEDNTSCIMVSETPTNRDRSKHVDVKVHFLRDLVCDGHM